MSSESLVLPQSPVAETGMLIRRPVAEVFNAFVDPAVTTRFWFTKSTGPLVAGEKVRWDWEMYGVACDVSVKRVEENRRIEIEWPSEYGLTTVEWTFTPHGEQATFVEIRNFGFQGTGDQRVGQALGSTGGFCWVLAGAKALLEHGIDLNLVADRFPGGK